LVAICTIKVRVRLVVIIGGQAVIKCPPACADALNNPVFHQQVKNAVDGCPVDRAAASQKCIDIVDRKGEINKDLNPPPMVEDPKRFYRSGEKKIGNSPRKAPAGTNRRNYLCMIGQVCRTSDGNANTT
jgi:hypothetical protein